MKNKYGICQWCLPVKGLKGCEVAAKLDLDGMELEFSEELVKNAKQYKEMAERFCIEFPTIGMNVFCDHSYVEKEGRHFFMESIKKGFHAAVIIGAKTIQIPAFYASEIRTDSELKCAAECFSEACELVKNSGLVIATENVLDLEQNQEFFRLVDQKNFGFYFDTQNLKQMKNRDNYHLLEGMKAHICEVHVKDCVIGEKDKFSCAVLGKGNTDFEETASHLKKMGYEGWIHLENGYDKPLAGSDCSDYAVNIQRDLQIIKNML